MRRFATRSFERRIPSFLFLPFFVGRPSERWRGGLHWRAGSISRPRRSWNLDDYSLTSFIFPSRKNAFPLSNFQQRFSSALGQCFHPFGIAKGDLLDGPWGDRSNLIQFGLVLSHFLGVFNLPGFCPCRPVFFDPPTLSMFSARVKSFSPFPPLLHRQAVAAVFFFSCSGRELEPFFVQPCSESLLHFFDRAPSSEGVRFSSTRIRKGHRDLSDGGTGFHFRLETASRFPGIYFNLLCEPPHPFKRIFLPLWHSDH